MKRWFFVNSTKLKFFFYGTGDTPASEYQATDIVDFKSKLEYYINEGYEFIKDQANEN